jgi:hypothetical protein
MVPAHLGAAVELGNLYLRLDNAHAARLAYARPLAQEKLPVEPLVRAQLQAQLASLDSTTDVTRLKPVRNPWME